MHDSTEILAEAETQALDAVEDAMAGGKVTPEDVLAWVSARQDGQPMPSQPAGPAVDFVHGGCMVDLRRLVSVSPDRGKRQIAIQLERGAYAVWRDIENPHHVAKQMLAARAALQGATTVVYDPAA